MVFGSSVNIPEFFPEIGDCAIDGNQIADSIVTCGERSVCRDYLPQVTGILEMTTATQPTKATHKELHNGVGGNGATQYMVVTVCDATGRWLHTETFTNKAEAESWMKFA